MINQLQQHADEEDEKPASARGPTREKTSGAASHATWSRAFFFDDFLTDRNGGSSVFLLGMFMAETFSDSDLRRFPAALRLLTRGQETNHDERTCIRERLQKDRR